MPLERQRIGPLEEHTFAFLSQKRYDASNFNNQEARPCVYE